MPSQFDQLDVELLAPVVMETYGELDASGEFLPLKYRQPGNNGEPILLTGIVLNGRGSNQELSPVGVDRVERKVWQIPREQVDAKGITHWARKATVEDDDGTWGIDENQPGWGPVFVNLTLTRAPQTAGNELRRASV